MLRQVLAVPFEAKSIGTPEDVDRLDRAREALQALGYDNDRISEASKRLRPSLSHKEQIKRIVVRLGLDADGDVARQWIAASNAVAAAHERLLHHAKQLDDEFRRRYARPLNSAIRGIVVKLAERYAELMLRVEDARRHAGSSRCGRSVCQ